MLGIFGNITSPFDKLAPGKYSGTNGEGLITILSNLVKLSIVVAGIYTLINFILAGYGYMGAGGDPKIIQRAQERIYRSIMGLVIIAGSFLIAGVVGYLIFGPSDWSLLISPTIYSP
jgi:hypothetical protein